MLSKFAAKVLLQTAKCRQYFKKNAEKVIFYAEKFDQFKKMQYLCSRFSVRCSRTANVLMKMIDF